ncbi:unnamed protein product, partial [Didymodactylos carnosus]
IDLLVDVREDHMQTKNEQKRRKNKIITDEWFVKLWQCYDDEHMDMSTFLKAAGKKLIKIKDNQRKVNPVQGRKEFL